MLTKMVMIFSMLSQYSSCSHVSTACFFSLYHG